MAFAAIRDSISLSADSLQEIASSGDRCEIHLFRLQNLTGVLQTCSNVVVHDTGGALRFDHALAFASGAAGHKKPSVVTYE